MASVITWPRSVINWQTPHGYDVIYEQLVIIPERTSSLHLRAAATLMPERTHHLATGFGSTLLLWRRWDLIVLLCSNIFLLAYYVDCS